jgi:hypothetical protein
MTSLGEISIWRTSCAEILYYGNVRFIEFLDLYREPLKVAFRQIYAFLPSGAKPPEIMLKAMAALNIEIKLPEFVSKIVKKMFVKISLITTGNTLFVTERGYIVLGDLDSRPGDGVFILHQGDVPFVLRKTGRKSVHPILRAHCTDWPAII